MRIHQHNITVRSVLFSKYMAFLYFALTILFAYKCIVLLPVWLSIRDSASETEIKYRKNIDANRERNEKKLAQESDIGKRRYEKDLFNSLDEGEHLIILYGDDVEKKVTTEETRKMFWWEEKKQDFYVWWRNLEVVKK